MKYFIKTHLLRIIYLFIFALVSIDVFNLIFNDVYPSKWSIVAWGIIFLLSVAEEFAMTFYRD